MPLLHDVLNAYLSPLLKKHSVGSVLTYDDLAASMEAAEVVLAESPNEFVLRRVQSLHSSQVRAYQDKAKESLETWAKHFAALPPVANGESQEAYVNRCWVLLKSKRPNWQISDEFVDECMHDVVVQRGTETYLASPNAIPTASVEDGEDGYEEGEMEDGEEDDGEVMENEEEEEVDEDEGVDGEVEEEDTSSQQQQQQQAEETNPTKSPQPNNNKRKNSQQGGRVLKKRIVKKKSTNSKKTISGGGKPPAGGVKKMANRNKKTVGKKGRAPTKKV